VVASGPVRLPNTAVGLVLFAGAALSPRCRCAGSRPCCPSPPPRSSGPTTGGCPARSGRCGPQPAGDRTRTGAPARHRPDAPRAAATPSRGRSYGTPRSWSRTSRRRAWARASPRRVMNPVRHLILEVPAPGGRAKVV